MAKEKIKRIPREAETKPYGNLEKRVKSEKASWRRWCYSFELFWKSNISISRKDILGIGTSTNKA